jgi:SAM-dependent methyltransferase
LIERDYGCGDPSRYVGEGEIVLDLGSGGGKICYIASQIVGPRGRVLGVDMNDDMLALARKYEHEIGTRIGWHNVQFFKGRIQDLALDLERLGRHLREHPVNTVHGWLEVQQQAERLRATEPMIASDSIDAVLSNCVLNLVHPADREQLFQEVFRVLRRGGRAVISDIVCDEPVPEHLRRDPQLWSGCISGAFVEAEFLAEFERVGFYGVEILNRQPEPWAIVEGIEFRSVTVRAYKGKDGPCLDCRQAVIYKGPWKRVMDDDGHTLERGVPMAVCDKTYRIYTGEPYTSQIVPVPPREPMGLDQAVTFDCRRNLVRDPRETKGAQARERTQLPTISCCGPAPCCS